MKDPREMTAGELRNWLADRLRMRGLASADLDLRRDEAPYERPLQLWKNADASFHHEFLRAVLALIEEAAAEPWDSEGFDQLMRLVEAGRIGEAASVLESVAHSRRLLACDQGAQLHMQVLRTLLALGWTGSPEFWEAQHALVGPRWPGLIFKGFARQDLGAAFARLPSLAVDAAAMRQILDMFPGLMRERQVGLPELRHRCHGVIGRLPPESAALLREWSALREVPIPLTSPGVNPTLQAAMLRFLGEAASPRIRDARLITA